MTILVHKHPGHHMQPMASTLDPPLTTTNDSNSTFLQCAASASPTPGTCTQPTAKAQLLCNMTSPLQQQQTSSRYLGVLYQHLLLKKISTSKPSRHSPQSWPDSKRPHQQWMNQLQGWLHHVQGWQILHHQGWLLHQTTSQHPMPPDRYHWSISVIHAITTHSTSFLINDDNNDDTVVASNCSQVPLQPSFQPVSHQ
jgi:hypothetical protein